jgi:hypothetical protein
MPSRGNAYVSSEAMSRRPVLMGSGVVRIARNRSNAAIWKDRYVMGRDRMSLTQAETTTCPNCSS